MPSCTHALPSIDTWANSKDPQANIWHQRTLISAQLLLARREMRDPAKWAANFFTLNNLQGWAVQRIEPTCHLLVFLVPSKLDRQAERYPETRPNGRSGTIWHMRLLPSIPPLHPWVFSLKCLCNRKLLNEQTFQHFIVPKRFSPCPWTTFYWVTIRSSLFLRTLCEGFPSILSLGVPFQIWVFYVFIQKPLSLWAMS